MGTTTNNLKIVILFILLAFVIAIAGTLFIYWFRYRAKAQRDNTVGLLDQMLKNRQQQSEILIESITDGIIVFDTSNRINLINSAAARLTEWQAKDAIGLDVSLVAKFMQENGQPIYESQNPLLVVMRQKTSMRQDIMLIGRNHKQTAVSVSVSPVIVPPDNKVIGVIMVLRDITQARKEERQRADFISTASHEMRTPVASIEGYLSLALSDKLGHVDEKVRGYLEKAHESTEHLGKLFQDLLTSAKAEDGRLASRPVAVEIGGFIKKVCDDMRFEAERKNLALQFFVGSSKLINGTSPKAVQEVVEPLFYAYVDPERLREAIAILIDNAVKYTARGKIIVGITGNEEIVQIYVRDTGQGVPAEDIPHLFQKFYRVDSSETQTINGTGLGLFIARKIVELYHGRIWLESGIGQGSIFYVNLPRLRPDQIEGLKNLKPQTEVLPTTTTSAGS